MDRPNIRIKLIAEHQFKKHVPSLMNPSKPTRLKSVDRRAIETVPKYRQYVYYYLMMGDKDWKNSFTVTQFGGVPSRSKQEAFLIHRIVRDRTEALLNLTHPRKEIATLAEMNLEMFPDIKIQIEHRYINKIPKQHLARRRK